jgi:hypothetical protein
MEDPLDDLYWRDEILQIMYWLRGENLGEVVSAEDLSPFLGESGEFIQPFLEGLVEEGFAERIEDGELRYQLTEMGIKEGGRRFEEEFTGLTNQGHGECNNPNCFCKTLGPAACISRVPHEH